MSAKKLTVIGATFSTSVSVTSRDARLELGSDKVTIHKNGMEFRSPQPFKEWSEMTVALLSPKTGGRISCQGVIVACTGSRHSGYHVSMVFTSLSSATEKQLGTMATSEFGAG
jgi:hypothetical protein